MQVVPPQCRQNIAKQVARNISQCHSALRHDMFHCQGRCISEVVVIGRTDGLSLSLPALTNTHVDIVILSSTMTVFPKVNMVVVDEIAKFNFTESHRG